MACYEYLCSEHGVIALDAPMGTAPETTPCPVCDVEVGRMYHPPMLAGPAAMVGLLDSCAATADTPAVVNALPAKAKRNAPRAPLDPRLNRLPRP